MAPRFRIHLQDAHKDKGLSPYKVALLTNVAQNTIKKYVEPEEVVVERIEGVLVSLIEFYGLDWRDPAVIEVIESPVERLH